MEEKAMVEQGQKGGVEKTKNQHHVVIVIEKNLT